MLKAAGEREDQRQKASQEANKSLADQHLEKLAETNGKGKGRATDDDPSQNFSKSRAGEGEVNLDKSKLANALAAERKRKAMGEDEAFEATKKAKSFNVSEEELGEFPLCLVCSSMFGSDGRLLISNRGLSTQQNVLLRRSHGELQGRRGVKDGSVIYCCSLYISFVMADMICDKPSLTFLLQIHFRTNDSVPREKEISSISRLLSASCACSSSSSVACSSSFDTIMSP